MFIEQDHQHWRNRRDAHYSSVRPARLANGEPGVSIRIGALFAVLSKTEFADISGRVSEAFAESNGEQP